MLGRSSASLRPAVRPASSRPTAQSSPPSAASCGSAASRRATDHRPPLGHEAGLPAIDRRLAFSGLALDRHRAHPIGAQQHNPHATHASVGCSPIQSPLLAFRGRLVQAAAELLKTFGVLSERSAWLLYLKASTLADGGPAGIAAVPLLDPRMMTTYSRLAASPLRARSRARGPLATARAAAACRWSQA